MKLYPLQFEPILKERIWGGTKLKSYLNKPITSEITGESWEISTVENDVSVVANGDFKGKSLNELITEFPNEIFDGRVQTVSLQGTLISVLNSEKGLKGGMKANVVIYIGKNNDSLVVPNQ